MQNNARLNRNTTAFLQHMLLNKNRYTQLYFHALEILQMTSRDLSIRLLYIFSLDTFSFFFLNTLYLSYYIPSLHAIKTALLATPATPSSLIDPKRVPP